MKSILKHISQVLLLAVMGLNTSCAPKTTEASIPTFPVKGKVLLNDKPANRVLVVFHPIDPEVGKKYKAYGRTAIDGTFHLSTFKELDGAPEGTYFVTIVSQDEESTGRVPLRYAATKTSGFRITIKPEPNNLPAFNLQSRL